MRDQSGGTIPESGKDAADYIADMSRDLCGLARRNHLTTIAYLLDMARLEAETIARGGGREGLFPLASEESVDAS